MLLLYCCKKEVFFVMNNISAIINEMKIKTRSDGRYEGRITVNGTRKSFYGNTKTVIKQKAKQYLLKVENGYREPEKIKLNDYIEYWLKIYKFNKIEPSSYSRLWVTYENQIKNTIGNKMIGKISTIDIQRLIDEYAIPTMPNTKPLSISGLKKIVHLLKPCLDKAVIENIIQNNPCNDVILPIESCIAVQTKEQITLTDSEIDEFKQAALSKYKTRDEYKSRDAFVLLLMLNLGLRVGETIALKWSDFNLDDKIVYINKTMQTNIRDFSNNQKIYSRVKDSTKTPNGVRVLKLNDSAIYYLSELKKYDKRNNIISPYLCSTHSNTLNTPRNLQRSLDRIVKQTSIKENITLHTLRHTFGSVLVRRGVGIEVVSSLMGHANITITYKKYIHVVQEQKAKAMNMVNVC